MSETSESQADITTATRNDQPDQLYQISQSNAVGDTTNVTKTESTTMPPTLPANQVSHVSIPAAQIRETSPHGRYIKVISSFPHRSLSK